MKFYCVAESVSHDENKLIVFTLYCLQLYLAPITHPDRYNGSIDFWRNVYGIDSEYDANLDLYFFSCIYM